MWEAIRERRPYILSTILRWYLQLVLKNSNITFSQFINLFLQNAIIIKFNNKNVNATDQATARFWTSLLKSYNILLLTLTLKMAERDVITILRTSNQEQGSSSYQCKSYNQCAGVSTNKPIQQFPIKFELQKQTKCAREQVWRVSSLHPIEAIALAAAPFVTGNWNKLQSILFFKIAFFLLFAVRYMTQANPC